MPHRHRCRHFDWCFGGVLTMTVFERRTAPSAIVAPASATDPIPCPEPSPGTDPGTDTPITPPPLPPSGPIGPGTS